jgi:hypothetical protein
MGKKTKILKPVEVILRRGSGGGGRIMEGMNQTGVQYMYVLYVTTKYCITIIY